MECYSKARCPSNFIFYFYVLVVSVARCLACDHVYVILVIGVIIEVNT